MNNTLLELELKELILDVLNLEDITTEDIASDMQLFGDELGLDSIDALELGVALKKKYNIELNEDQGASGLIIDFGTSKSAKIESLPSAVIL